MHDAILDREEAASTLAVVVASNEPLLFLTADLKVIAASSSFCRAFQIDPRGLRGKPLAEIGAGEWAMPKLASLLKATASGSAEIENYEIDLERPGKDACKLIIFAQILDDGHSGKERLLVAISDVTKIRDEARIKDNLIRDKAVLVREVQHRVANSLQIIASVLMQSARRVQSEEARGYLQNAHHRVLSIAAVQKLLSTSQTDKIVVKDYLVQLADSLGASMIADPERLAIRVDVDDSDVEAQISVSLGLIVTELVINALKHAFPEHQSGTISIRYHSEGKDWTLSVIDDGVGMSTGIDAPKAGLGTGIVEALTNNLLAVIEVTDAKPGTAVTVSHRAASATAKKREAPAV